VRVLDGHRLQTLEHFEPLTNHEDAVTIDGLDDLFNWASEMVADGSDPRTRRVKEQKLRRNMLDIIQRNRELEAKEKFSEEINYLHRRVMALLQIVSEKMEENASLRHIVMSQYYALFRVANLEEEVKQLEKLTWYRDEAEAERKHLMDALAKMKKERDYLEDLVTVNEGENNRLALMLNETREELAQLKARRWWHIFSDLFRSIGRLATPA